MTRSHRTGLVAGAVVGLVLGVVLFAGERSIAAVLALSVGMAIPAAAVGYLLARGSERR